jgi:hypothetical protein
MVRRNRMRKPTDGAAPITGGPSLQNICTRDSAD